MQSQVKVQPASGIAAILNQTASTFISMTQNSQGSAGFILPGKWPPWVLTKAWGLLCVLGSPSLYLWSQSPSFHPLNVDLSNNNFPSEDKTTIDWPFLDGFREIEIALRAPFPFPTQASVCFKMEMIIFIMEELCQDWKAWKHEKRGYRARVHFLNISFWLNQLFLLPLSITWGIICPFREMAEYQEGLCT